jgi:hypothetical protein
MCLNDRFAIKRKAFLFEADQQDLLFLERHLCFAKAFKCEFDLEPLLVEAAVMGDEAACYHWTFSEKVLIDEFGKIHA